MTAGGDFVRLRHPRWGTCKLLRVEGTDWIVQFDATGQVFRFPSESRKIFQGVNQPTAPAPSTPAAGPRPAESRQARRVIESLRIGLPSLDGSTRHFAIGFDQTRRHIENLLADVDQQGGSAMILKGAYGEGKIFALSILEDMAVEAGFIAARTEVDATENRLNKPHHVYRDLMRNLRIPGSNVVGVRGLVEQADEVIRKSIATNDPYERKRWLDKHVGCESLSWLLSDPHVTRSPELLGLLECDPNYPAAQARRVHSEFTQPRYWPTFSAGTQGDFASYLLSGIGRLARLLGHKGMVIIMDEMEKWQDLNWKEQAQAGNLLGGLIWAASAEKGKRSDRHRPKALEHSLRCGGYPFTIPQRCHLGIAIAMTPRGEDNPEDGWCEFGRIEIAYLPRLTPQKLREYCSLVAPHFAGAYGLDAPDAGALGVVEKEALATWRLQSDLSMRSGVQSAIAAFDHWRDERQFRRGGSVL